MGRPVGWILGASDRAQLLAYFPPRYERVIAHHVTLWGHRQDAPVPGPASFAVIGHSDAGTGIEALVVLVDGQPRRPDGHHYHLTWSLDPATDRVPRDSNALIAEHGWSEVDPIPFHADPGYVA
ncbi:hypothetical protein [Sphingomicrobium astaxanthinifaciens]|uniref:hypothetical protein n=1 Tax=Sphingomicrobium astaxanthinifaciens TaxID=1227949 RepID=UPI001FCC6C82|nr:hypothetical protein [Sphingomicrobium astaxanthinifaciens]MCJ7421880.1 hypothetical protein [Sphingomicrobium astaxanthinifaciens]